VATLKVQGDAVRCAQRRYVSLVILIWSPIGISAPFEIPLLRSRGYSLSTIGALVALFMVVTAAAEVPSGAAADRFGRAWLLSFSGLLTSAGLLVLAVGRPVPAAALAMILLALARAAGSGVLEAWFVDLITAIEPDRSVAEGLSIGIRAELITQALAALTTAFLLAVAFDRLLAKGALQTVLRYLFVAASVAAFVIGVLIPRLMSGPDAGAHPPDTDGQTVLGLLRSAVRRSIWEGPFRLFLARSALMASGAGIIEVLLPARLTDSISSANRLTLIVGFYAAASYAAGAIGTTMVKRMEARAWANAVRCTIVAALLIGAAGFVRPPMAVAACLLSILACGPVYPLLADAFHGSIPASDRVTLLSVYSLVGMLGATAGTVVIPALAQWTSYRWAFVASGLLAASAAGVLALPSFRRLLEQAAPNSRGF
jgi:MFS family permease